MFAYHQVLSSRVVSAVLLLFCGTLPTTVFSQALFEYETIPVVNENRETIRVGGDDGGPFELHRENQAVKKLEMWRSGNIITAIRVTFSDDVTMSTGKINTGAPNAFDFSPGEKVTGNVILTGNGIGTRLGFMKFKTSNGKEFAFGGDNGAPSSEFSLTSGESYLMGFFGTSGVDIDSLGLYMMKPLKKESIVNTIYTIPPNPDKEPKQLKQEKFENGSPAESKLTLTYSKTLTSSKEWSSTNTFSSTLGIEVSGTIPVIDVGVSVSAELTMGMEASATSTMVEEKTVEESREVTNPPCSKGNHTITDFEYNSPVQYTGQFLYEFTDGTAFSLDVSGIFKSIFVTSSVVITKTEALSGGLCGDVAPATIPSPGTVVSMSPVAPANPIVTNSPVIAPAVITGRPIGTGSPVATGPIGTGSPVTVSTSSPVAAQPMDNNNGQGGAVVYIEHIENAQFFFNGENIPELIVGVMSPTTGSMSMKGRRLGNVKSLSSPSSVFITTTVD